MQGQRHGERPKQDPKTRMGMLLKKDRFSTSFWKKSNLAECTSSDRSFQILGSSYTCKAEAKMLFRLIYSYKVLDLKQHDMRLISVSLIHVMSGFKERL